MIGTICIMWSMNIYVFKCLLFLEVCVIWEEGYVHTKLLPYFTFWLMTSWL